MRCILQQYLLKPIDLRSFDISSSDSFLEYFNYKNLIKYIKIFKI